ncbi:iron dicitrate transport regulator FecR [Leptospira hartskeerlii]|uniref:Iron dicitrate transport regulator FecR n=1 Tax=Leptospira hartskeerlii TaxID=2023177 RepID=A0A2M9XDI7_9LEPT|nr:FecR domain-containing protein [Leptospira hartskeerlii]PJZ25659.1 iron dicitrate transport regulator FecR [Leptospira hartskeerlii]PJZ35517.1 iron dicitrate transport regulator FecR [Leptospira hartskeerlii]
MKKLSVLFLLGITCVLFSCGKKEADAGKGVITFVVGNVTLERGSEKSKAEVSKEIQNGDILVTDEGATATIAFGENASLLEIQSGSRFRFDDIKSDKKFFQEKGRSWILSNKLVKGEGLSLGTPTTTAGVRGTKFYTSIVEDMTFICHCQGKVELENSSDHSKMIPESDYLTVTKGTKTIVIDKDDLLKIGIPYVHNHSEVSDSPVGERTNMKLEDFLKIQDLAKKKLAGK